MYNPIPPAPSCATGWLAAAQHLVSIGDDAYNVIVDIDNPATHSEYDRTVVMKVDRFLREHKANPIATVANTIFPKELARRSRGAELRTQYLKRYETFGEKGWGRYFERMVRWPGDDSDQLHNLVERLRTQIATGNAFHNVYELALFDPPSDAKRNMNRQCLSHLSFKLHPDRGLMLTAIYRNHYYITRALGNFIGLGNLMKYIAEQTELQVGPLTCISTHAQIDTASKKPSKKSYTHPDDTAIPWTIRDARALIQSIPAARTVAGIRPKTAD